MTKLDRSVDEVESREIAESARESAWSQPSFLRELFLGRFRLELIHPHPEPDLEEEKRAEEFLDQLAALMERVDSDAIDRDGKIPEEIVHELRDIGAFGIKIPREYGGLGFSQLTYNRANQLISSKDANIAALISAHQSIGVPQPLKLFGTPEQKKKYFPQLANGAISAFALTEFQVGSDPANLRTTAVPAEDGKAFILNGAQTGRGPNFWSSWRAHRPGSLTGRKRSRLQPSSLSRTGPASRWSGAAISWA